MRTRYIVLLVAALSAGAGYLAHSFLTRGNGGSSLAESLLQEASTIIETSREENIIKLAPEAFTEAEAAVSSARALLDSEGSAAAQEPARDALTRSREAREAALARITIRRTAVVRKIIHRVLHRSASGLAWSDAKQRMSLFDGDRVATRDRSEALIHFSDGNELRVEQNSVVAIRRFVENRMESLLNAELSVDKGYVRSLVTRDGVNDVRMEFNLPSADVVIDTMDSEDGQAEVGVRTNSDQSNSVAVYKGKAEVIGNSGERLVLKKDHFTEISVAGELSEPKPLPPAVTTLSPAHQAKVYVSPGRGEVALRWQRLEVCQRYRVQLARDAEFENKAMDELARRARLTARGLEAGEYAWRACCVGEEMEEGPYSEPKRFEVILDDEAPRLAVLVPQPNAVVSTQSITAHCRTEPSAVVFINGEEANAVSGGEFKQAVALMPGVNALVFEAMDSAGNITYTSQLVTLRQ